MKKCDHLLAGGSPGYCDESSDDRHCKDCPAVPVKVYWLSRHSLSPAQVQAIKRLHGEDVIILHEPIVLEGLDALAEAIHSRNDGFVYAVAPAHMVAKASIACALGGYQFGVFENHPLKRADGSFGLKAVYHILPDRYEPMARIVEVWTNPDPLSDQGEALIPIERRNK